jgi:hypothetical protein
VNSDLPTGPPTTPTTLDVERAKNANLFAGRYCLRLLIGQGGMADVYSAFDEVLGRAVAIKLFRPDSNGDRDRRRIDREFKTLGALRHPGWLPYTMLEA